MSASRCPLCGVGDGEEHIHERHAEALAYFAVDAVVDKVLAHKPKPKSSPARKRARRRRLPSESRI